MFDYERGMKEIVQCRRALIVIPPLSNHLYHLYLWAIIRELQGSDLVPIIVFNHGPASANGKFLELNRKSQKIESKFLSYLVNHGLSPDSILLSEDIDVKFRQDHSELQSCITAGDLLNINLEYPLLNLSLHSIFVSFVSSADEKLSISRYKSLLGKMQDSFHFSYALCSALGAIYDFDEVIFLNGRDPGQAGVRHFAEEKLLSWHALEHGIAPGESFHLEGFQTQDRIAIQERMGEAAQKLSKSELTIVQNWYEGWSDKQRKNRLFNSNVRTGSIPSDWINSHSKYVPIFTTSLDEDISSVGYSRIDLRDLINQTIEAAKQLESAGFLPVIVVHPNSLNKSWTDLRLLFLSLRNTNFRVVWPWQNISSYELIALSTFCVTWRSTIALEALIEGKPTMNLAESTYDVFVRVPKFSLGNIVTYDFVELQRNALLYLFFWMNHGHNIYSFLPDSEYRELKNELHGRIASSRKLGALRYYYSILSVPFRWGKATPKQLQRFLQLFKNEPVLDFVFKKLLSLPKYEKTLKLN